MVNRILYWLVTLPRLLRLGFVGTAGLFLACACLFVASIPGNNARQAQNATATTIARFDAETQVAINSTATGVAQATAAAQAEQDATATSAAVAELTKATAAAAPTITAQAYLDATATSIALATEQAAQSATALVQAEQASATAVAVQATKEAEAADEAAQATAAAVAAAEATATIEDYRRAMPKGFWLDNSGSVGVAVGGFEYTQKAGYTNAGPGAAFVAFSVAVYNNGSSTIQVNPNNLTLVDLEGRSYSYDAATFSYWSQPLKAVDVRSGNSAVGGIVFLIDKDSAPAQIIYDVGGFLGGTVVIDLRRPPDQTE